MPHSPRLSATLVLVLPLAVAVTLAPGAARAQAPLDGATPALRDSVIEPVAADSGDVARERWSSFLPLLGEEARKRGIVLPLPFGAGAVLYYLDRDIAITDVRVGRNGAPPRSVTDYATLSARARVTNLNAKFDVWILPFVNLYAIAGWIHNESSTRIDVELPPLLPSGSPRRRTMNVATELDGSVGGLGTTLAGGYGPYFMVADFNWARADLGFSDKFDAKVTSLRAGWNGRGFGRPLQLWANGTDWNTATTATGTVADPDGGTLAFEVDQGPRWRKTYGVGGQLTIDPHFALACDVGFDLHGGWYLALVPVGRF